MKSEMDSMSENKVWTLSDAPEGVKPIRYKWVFKKKARLVAKGYRQRHQLNPRQLNEYHRGYLEGNPSHVIETRKKNILVAIGSTYTHRV